MRKETAQETCDRDADICTGSPNGGYCKRMRCPHYIPLSNNERNFQCKLLNKKCPRSPSGCADSCPVPENCPHKYFHNKLKARRNKLIGYNDWKLAPCPDCPFLTYVQMGIDLIYYYEERDEQDEEENQNLINSAKRHIHMPIEKLMEQLVSKMGLPASMINMVSDSSIPVTPKEILEDWQDKDGLIEHENEGRLHKPKNTKLKKIKCVDAEGSDLIVGNLYDLLSKKGDLITVRMPDGSEQQFFIDRFELEKV